MRAPALQIFSSVRAFFAPVERATATPAPFAPASAATFNIATPPAPWLSLGEVRAFHRTPTTAHAAVHVGPKGAVATQLRTHLGARIDFDFLQWGKLQMAIAGGTGQCNVLAADNGATVAPVAVLDGSTAAQLNIASADAAGFHAGDLIACDVHYAGQTGYLGSGISAAYVTPGQTSDRDFIRRVTFNVARIVSITQSSDGTTAALTLDQPLPGGAPAPNSFVQRIAAFTDRESGSFFHEWSALFFLASESGGNICFYYPRLQPSAPALESTLALDLAHSTNKKLGAPHNAPSVVWGSGDQAATNDPGLSLATLHASFNALPITDSTDNEQVVCYRSFTPAPTAPLY